MSDVREASLESEVAHAPGGVPGQLGPFLILAAGGLWLHGRWDLLPERMPVHWNWLGEANGFVHRSVFGASLPLLLGLAQCVLLLALQFGIRHGAPRGGMRAPSLKLILASEYLTALVSCGALAAAVTGGRFLGASLLLTFGGGLALAVASWVIVRTTPRAPARNPSAWRGPFYADREDPALFVPKRYGVGYTFNFGNPFSLAMLAALLFVPLAIAGLLISAR